MLALVILLGYMNCGFVTLLYFSYQVWKETKGGHSVWETVENDKISNQLFVLVFVVTWPYWLLAE